MEVVQDVVGGHQCRGGGGRGGVAAVIRRRRSAGAVAHMVVEMRTGATRTRGTRGNMLGVIAVGNDMAIAGGLYRVITAMTLPPPRRPLSWRWRKWAGVIAMVAGSIATSRPSWCGPYCVGSLVEGRAEDGRKESKEGWSVEEVGAVHPPAAVVHELQAFAVVLPAPRAERGSGRAWVAPSVVDWQAAVVVGEREAESVGSNLARE